MTDQDIIKDAYSDALKNLFNVFFQAFAIAANDNDRQQAKQRFTAGLTQLRASRDAALALV